MPDPILPKKSRRSEPRAVRERKYFTNRVVERNRFDELLDAKPGDPLPLLMFYGIGGAGKTSLLKHFQERCTEVRVPWAAVDLDESPEADRGLPRLAARFMESDSHFKFKGFGRVVAALTAKETGSLSTPEIAAGAKGLRSGFDTLLDGLGILPVVGQLAMLAKLSKTAVAQGFKVAMKNRAFRDAVLKMDGQGDLLELLAWDGEELEEEMIRRFAADLVDTMPRRGKRRGAIGGPVDPDSAPMHPRPGCPGRDGGPRSSRLGGRLGRGEGRSRARPLARTASGRRPI